MLGSLQEDGWIDEATRAVMLELGLHSFSARKLLYARILVELPSEGGAPLTDQSYITFNAFNSFDTLIKLIFGTHGRTYWSDLGNDGGGLMGDRCVLYCRSTEP